jgi:hypothetical protein
MQRLFIKKYLLFMVGSVYRVKWFTAGSRNSLKDIQKFADDAPPGLEVTETTGKRLLCCGF